MKNDKLIVKLLLKLFDSIEEVDDDFTKKLYVICDRRLKIKDVEINTNNIEITSLNIKSLVAAYFNMASIRLDFKTKKRQVVQARQLAHYFSIIYTNESLSEIGKNIGGKDHSTVLHSKKTITNLADTDKKIRDIINKLDVFIKSNI